MEITDIELTAETKSFDILGSWSGENSRPGVPDKVIFEITKVDGNKIEATYSYTSECVWRSGKLLCRRRN